MTRRAFTLIELLVVIALIALLIGILLPSLAAARESSKALRATVSARSLMQAYAMYTNDNGDWLLPGYLTAAQVAEGGIIDEFGDPVLGLTAQRWAYRLGSYFDHVWSGTTHIDSRADLLEDKVIILETEGRESWAYQVSVLPSFGLNYRYVGGNFARGDWIAKDQHVKRAGDALAPSGLLTFVSARFYGTSFLNGQVTTSRVDGYLHVETPFLDAVFDEEEQTRGGSSGFGNVHPRYSNAAAVSWLDGHVSIVQPEDILDRRIWSDSARRLNDPVWEP
ncbi:MAG: prepilin-type N-terminal cleavage/methylation domain-containing protein [Planctomycetota bacterium]